MGERSFRCPGTNLSLNLLSCWFNEQVRNHLDAEAQIYLYHFILSSIFPYFLSKYIFMSPICGCATPCCHVYYVVNVIPYITFFGPQSPSLFNIQLLWSLKSQLFLQFIFWTQDRICCMVYLLVLLLCRFIMTMNGMNALICTS